MLYWFLPHINMEQPQVYVTSLMNLPPTSHPIPPSKLSQSTRLRFLCYRKFPFAIYFTYGNVYTSILLSQFIPPSPCPAVSISLFSMSESLFRPCKQVHQYRFPRFHIYALIHDLFLFLTYFTLNKWLQVLPSHQI